jgi:DNA-damage-inducible protein J
MTQVNFRIEDDIKNNAEQALKEMGLNMSTAITMFLVKVGRERRIPFEITANYDPFYSPENMARLKRSAEQMEQTGGTVHELGEINGHL